MVRACDVSVMRGLGVIARLVVLGGFMMMLSGMAVMLGRALVVFCCFMVWHSVVLERLLDWGARLANQVNATSVRLRADEPFDRFLRFLASRDHFRSRSPRGRRLFVCSI
jgi:hypothetical protein